MIKTYWLNEYIEVIDVSSCEMKEEKIGRFIPHPNPNFKNSVHCSECGTYFTKSNIYNKTTCPHCGIKIKGEI